MVRYVVQSYPEVLRPHVVGVYRNGRPDAVLVGRLERKQFHFKVGYLTVQRPWVRCLTFVYGAIRGNESLENAEILVRAVVECLRQGEADMAMFENVRTDSPLYQLVLTVPGILCRDPLPSPQARYVMCVPNSVGEVLGRMSGSRRKHLRSNERKLRMHPDGEFRITCYRRSSELGLLFQDAEQIAKRTYQRGLSVGFRDTPVVQQRLDLAASKGWLRGYVLYLGNRPIAFWIGMLYEGMFVSEYLGYDPEFRAYGAGMVLITQVIASFCRSQNGQTIGVDFGPGDAEYKTLLSTEHWHEAHEMVFSPTFKGFRLMGMRLTTRILDRSARKMLHSTKLFSVLKRFWRDRLAKHAAR